MIWYLVICGLSPYKSTCTFSPAFTSKEQCRFVEGTVRSANAHWTTCIGVRK